MYGCRALPRIAAETGVDPSCTRSARCASRRPGALRGAPRQAGWARTFGLPIELDAERGPGPLPADDDRRRPRRRLAADRRLARPVGARVRAGRGRTAARRAGPARITGSRDRRARRPGHRLRSSATAARSHRGRCRRQRRWHLRARDRAPGRCHRAPHPMAHQYLFTGAIEGVDAGPAAAARSGQPRLLPRGDRRPVHGRLRARPGAVGARRHPGRLQPPAARPGLAAVRADHGGAIRRVPGDRGRRGHADHQRPGGLHAGQRVHPGRERGPRVLRRRGLLGPRDRRRGRHRSPGRPLDRGRRARARPVADGYPPLRARVPAAGIHAARPRELRDVLRHPLSQRGATAGRPLRLSPAVQRLAALGAAFGEKSGWSGRTGSSPTRTRRVAEA